MLPLLLRLKSADWRKVGAAAGFFLVLALAVLCYLQRLALEQAELVYHNPRRVEKVRVVKVVGPVRIVTRVVEVDGRKETVTEEVRGPVVESSDSLNISEPVFPPAPRSDRWLAGAALDPFRYRDTAALTAFGGYSFRNRLDLCAGVTMKGRPRVLAMVRF